MAARSLTRFVVVGLFAAACGAPSAQQSATRARPDTIAHAPAPSRVAALLADADVAEASGDALSARTFLSEAVALEPGNEDARARLASLGGASEPPAAPVVAPAVAPPVPTVVAAAARRTGTGAERRPRRVVLGGERARLVSARRDRSAVSGSAISGTGEGAVAALPPVGDSTRADLTLLVTPVRTVKHTRTWPWTRAQRWLVAKGLGGGAGVGVVLGAVIGNVPGALIAGSLTGGAVGFHRATKIGPAEPYPTEHQTATFDAKQQGKRADSVAVAGRPAAQPSATLAVRP